MTRGLTTHGPPHAAPRVVLAPPDEERIASIDPWFAGAWLDMFGRPAERAGMTAPDAASWLVDPGDGLQVQLVLAGSATFATLAIPATPAVPANPASQEAVGFIAARTDPADATGDRILTIVALAIAPAHRNLGFGAEAVYAAEAQHKRAAGSRALVPIGNGLALYFWLRVGYRPLFAARHGRAGVTVMERRPPLTPAGADQPAAQ